MYPDRDFDAQSSLPWNEAALVQDLELNVLWNAMAAGDKLIFDVARRVVLSPLTDAEAIRYRQRALDDALEHRSVLRSMYDIAAHAIDAERKHYWGLGSKYPSSILRRSTHVMEEFVPRLRQLRDVAAQYRDYFRSEAFTNLFATLLDQLPEPYFGDIGQHLAKLEFSEGMMMSAHLGEGNKGAGYIVRWLSERQRSWLERLFGERDDAFTFRIHPRDEAGWRALSQLNDRGINLVANALAQSCDHILSFFVMLRAELAFYVGCVNLHERLSQYGQPVCLPEPAPLQERRHTARALYDPCLSLQLEGPIVASDLAADEKTLVIITGANQGGKSTFLRAIGVAQLMMQCGMFVTAESFSVNICGDILTHYKREEDPSMKSGKLDEELARMSNIADHVTPNSLLLFNESFAATNEREGSEIAEQIVTALLECRTKMFFVTHLYEFAHHFAEPERKDVGFLRAQRQPDGVRTFKLLQGPPLKTSFGEDLYVRIFGDAPSW